MQKVSTYVGATWSCPSVRTLKPDHITRPVQSTTSFQQSISPSTKPHQNRERQLLHRTFNYAMQSLVMINIFLFFFSQTLQYTLIFMDQNLTSYSHAILKSCGTYGICQ